MGVHERVNQDLCFVASVCCQRGGALASACSTSMDYSVSTVSSICRLIDLRTDGATGIKPLDCAWALSSYYQEVVGP
ncbi:unnamed protein product [Phytophthora fragariaefolia]|uniref:Unnamed protein product n=1 Tax=Phytophthora fragariaefolia TaxID=1490495 RepID=A0A9W6U034_9STRA|nr:unnamed protein product [Phytophthora fragariaefolia]